MSHEHAEFHRQRRIARTGTALLTLLAVGAVALGIRAIPEPRTSPVGLAFRVELPVAVAGTALSGRSLLWALSDETSACSGDLDAGLADGSLGYALVEADAVALSLGGREIDAMDGGWPQGEVRGLLHVELYEALRGLVERSGQSECPATVALAIAPNLPYDTVQMLLFTVGETGVASATLLVDGPASGATASPLPEQPTRLGLILDRGKMSALRVPAVLDAVPEVLPIASLDALPPELDDPDCAVVVPESATPWGEVVATLDGLASRGIRRHSLHLSAACERDAPAGIELLGCNRRLEASDRIGLAPSGRTHPVALRPDTALSGLVIPFPTGTPPWERGECEPSADLIAPR